MRHCLAITNLAGTLLAVLMMLVIDCSICKLIAGSVSSLASSWLCVFLCASVLCILWDEGRQWTALMKTHSTLGAEGLPFLLPLSTCSAFPNSQQAQTATVLLFLLQSLIRVKVRLQPSHVVSAFSRAPHTLSAFVQCVCCGPICLLFVGVGQSLAHQHSGILPTSQIDKALRSPPI